MGFSYKQFWTMGILLVIVQIAAFVSIEAEDRVFKYMSIIVPYTLIFLYIFYLEIKASGKKDDKE